VQDALAIVVVAVVVIAALVGVATLLTSRSVYERIGRGDLTFEREAEAVDGREEEIRQMVSAANARRAARGQPQLDVEAEVARRVRRQDE
jgi:hypothetical protein